MFRACCECARTPHTSTHTFLGYHCLPVLFPSPSQNWLHSVPVLLYMNPFHHSYFIVDFIKPSQASMRYATYRHCLALLLFHFPSTPPFTTNDDSMLASSSIIFLSKINTSNNPFPSVHHSGLDPSCLVLWFSISHPILCVPSASVSRLVLSFYPPPLSPRARGIEEGAETRWEAGDEGVLV